MHRKNIAAGDRMRRARGGRVPGQRRRYVLRSTQRTWVLGAPPGVCEYPDCRSELIGATLPDVICTVAGHLLTVK